MTHQAFRPTALRLGLALASGTALSMVTVLPCWADSTNTADVPVITTPTQTSAQIPDQMNRMANADNLSANVQANFQYTTNGQAIADKIAQQLDNQTLTNFNNFNQPTATLSTQQSPIGLDNTLAIHPVDDSPVAPAIDSPKKILDQQIAKAVVTAQLTEQNSDAVTLSNASNPSIDPLATQKNAVQQSEDIQVDAVIDPNDYLPEYQQQATSVSVPKNKTTVTADPVGVVKRLKNRVLNRAQGVNYIDIKIVNADDQQQPAKNIKAALEEVTVESVQDFNSSIGRLRQIALDAAQAVGYYNTKASFRHLGGDNIEVTLEVGEPVKVTNRIVDIRGEGTQGNNALPVYEVVQENIPPNVGDVFSHGTYKQAKSSIEAIAQTNGFFDGKWLDSSADIILPDNTAQVDLIYDTKTRYQFGDIKVYAVDKQGNLTDDPDKLPLKPELIQKLMTYHQGDNYYQPFVSQFANNLTATRYFNAVNLDVVLPNDAMTTTDGLSFENRQAQNTLSPSDGQNQSDSMNVAENDNQALNSQAVSSQKSASQNTDPKLTDSESINDRTRSDKSRLDSQKALPNNQVQNPDDIAPLDFSVDDTLQERLNAINQKAENLLTAPEDIQLAPEEINKSRNPLVVVANAVSSIAKKIDRNEPPPIVPKEEIPKLSPEQVLAQKSVPTYVVLDANRPREAQVGIGYETDIGMRVVGKINNNLVNRSGYQAGISTALSKNDQSIEVTGSGPYHHPLNDKLTGSLGYERRNVENNRDTFTTNSVYANVARNIRQESGWNRTYSLRYRADELALLKGGYEEDSLPYPFNSQMSGFNQQSLLFGYALNKTVADNVLVPNFGYNQRYSVEVGAKGLLTDANVAILRAGATGIYSFGEANRNQIIGRADIGYIYSDDFANVPYRIRFFAGGDQSIRGYTNDSLGPTYGIENFLTGGNALAVGSLEYNYEFRKGLRAALFTDFGNAYDVEGGENIDNSTKVGVGVGVRWASPIGTVRLDVASGISEEDRPIRLHFFIGSPLN